MNSDLNAPGRLLASLTWTEVAESVDADSIVLLPIGAIEAHGPHLSLDTDVIIAQAAAQSAAHQLAAIGRDVWIAPPNSVRTDRFAALEPLWIDLPARLKAGANTFDEAGGTLAYFGDPANSSADDGRQLIHALGEIIVESCLDARDQR